MSECYDTDAYQAGVADCRADKPQYAPYTQGTTAWYCYNRGWADAWAARFGNGRLANKPQEANHED